MTEAIADAFYAEVSPEEAVKRGLNPELRPKPDHDPVAALKGILEIPEAVKALANWGDRQLIAARAAVANAEGR